MTAAVSAETVFDEALQSLKNYQPQHDLLQRWKANNFTIDDIALEVQDARSQCTTRSGRKASKWLARLSEKIMLYSPVMDVFAQLDPQYVCLAWGTTKFLLMLFMNHEESIHQLSKSLTKIALVLPMNSIIMERHPNVHSIRQAAQSIYELLIGHFQEMLIFYKEKPWRRVFSNVFKPFKVRFEERLKQIDEYSRTMSLLGTALAHREDHQAHATQVELLNRILDISQNHFQLSKDHMMVSNDMRVGLMVAASKSCTFQNAADALGARIALCRRHATPRGIDINTLWRSRMINTWSTQSTSALLLIRGSRQLRTQTEFVGTKMVQAIKIKKTPILFAFQGGRGSKQISTSPIQILQYLLEQAMQLNAEKLESLISKDLNATRVSTASTVEQWTQLLASALSNLPLVYIYVDLDLITAANAFQDTMADLIKTIQLLWRSCPATTIKVVFASYQRTLNVRGSSAQTSVLDLGKVKRR